MDDDQGRDDDGRRHVREGPGKHAAARHDGGKFGKGVGLARVLCRLLSKEFEGDLQSSLL